MRLNATLSALSVLIIITPLHAQDVRVLGFPHDCLRTSRQFDFWIGEWELKSVDSGLGVPEEPEDPPPRRVVQLVAERCAVFERTAWGGKEMVGLSRVMEGPPWGEGEDYTGDVWLHTDVGTGGQIFELKGGLVGESISWTGDWNVLGAPVRRSLTPLPDGTVSETFEVYGPDGEERWILWYDWVWRPLTEPR